MKTGPPAQPPGLVVVCGPTASGKTALGLALAARLGGEVVSADAFAVYRGMDIGTAKATAAERSRVPHHLVDIADPRERYSAGQFLRDADLAIADIVKRGRVPVVVGGTHFYVRALLQGLFPEPPKDPELRLRLEAEWQNDPTAVRTRLAALDPQAAGRIAAEDRQRTLRALEVCMLSGRAMTELWREHTRAPRYRSLIVAIGPPRAELHARIASRVARMFAVGLIDEVLRLVASGVPSQAHALKAIGYRESIRVIQGLDTAAGAEADTIVATRQLAKRQVTWLRGEGGVEWLGGTGEQLLTTAAGLVEAWRGLEHGAAQGQ